MLVNELKMVLTIDVPGKVTAHVESTADALELGETLNLDELGVVGNLQVVGDLGELRERNVGQVLVCDESDSLTDRSQVRRSEGLETVVVETERAVEGLERRNGDGTAEAESQVTSPDQVGELNLDGLIVVGQGKRLGDIAQLHGDGVNVAVVCDEDLLDLLNVDTLEGAKSGVLDVDVLGRRDLGGEANVLEVGQRVPLDRVDGLELGEVDGVERGEAVEVHLSVELGEVAGADLLDVRVGHGGQVASDLLDAVDGDVVGGAGRDGDAAREGRAGGEGGGVAGILDSQCRGGTAGGCVDLLAVVRSAVGRDIPYAVLAMASAGRAILSMEGILCSGSRLMTGSNR